MSKKPPVKQRKEAEKEVARKVVTREEELLRRAAREIQQMSYITPYLLSTKLEVKIGVAKRILRELEKEGKVKLVSPNRRSPLYVLVSQ
jgi:small subunit ribosomal protein S25e